jgi:ribosomal-protein-alanine N-acetyltransferase
MVEGKQIYLKILTPEDVTQKYVDWMNDKEIGQYLESRFNKHTTESVKSYVRDFDPKKNLLFGIFCNTKKNHIGNIKIGNINEYHKFADIGLVVGDKDYWSKGIASEAIMLVCKYGFETLKLHKLTAGMYEKNMGSYKAFIKNDFKEVGRYKKHYKFENTYLDGILVEKLNPNFS